MSNPSAWPLNVTRMESSTYERGAPWRSYLISLTLVSLTCKLEMITKVPVPWDIVRDEWDEACKKPSNHKCSVNIQFSSVAQSCPTLCDSMDCSTPGLPVHHQHPELTQTPAHWVGDAIQPSHPLSSPSPPAFNLFQHQGLFQRVSSSHQVAKVLEFKPQHQSFQWTFRTDFF